MVTFLPFKGYRPRLAGGETIGDRLSPQFDTVTEEQIEQLKSHPGNVANLASNPDQDKRYTKSRKLLDEMVSMGGVLPDMPMYYFYEQNYSMEGKEYSRHAIIGILKVEEYKEGHVFQREETPSKTKTELMTMLRDMEASTDSIIGIIPGLGEELYKKIDNTARLCARYVDPDGVEHRFTRIPDESLCNEIAEKMKNQTVLIAGRQDLYDAALGYAKENPDCESKQFALCTLISKEDAGLKIRQVHRMIDAEDIGETSSIKKISKKMKIVEVSQDDMLAQMKDHLFGMIFRSGKCLLLDNLSDDTDMLSKLDSYSAQENILKGVYKYDEGKSKISYSSDLETVLKEMKDKKHDAAIILNEPEISTIWNISTSGKKMPKRSIEYLPKMYTGWVFYKME